MLQLKFIFAQSNVSWTFLKIFDASSKQYIIDITDLHTKEKRYKSYKNCHYREKQWDTINKAKGLTGRWGEGGGRYSL